MRSIVACILGILISVSVQAGYTLAVFGDSLSYGHSLPKKEAFCAQLEQALRLKGYDISVLNVSKNGETTSGGLNRLNTLLSRKPNAVILELGINDSFRNTPITTIRGNLKKMIDTLHKNQIPVLLAGMKTLPNKPITYQQQFETMYRDLATEYDLNFYPFFMDGIFDATTTFNLRVPNDNLLPNDVHPSPKGVFVIVQGILPTVEDFLNKNGVLPH